MHGRTPPAPDRRRLSSLRSERGGALIEIMVSAVLVALVATAVFKSIDGASATSGGNKARGIATSLVQEDQDRMRAMDPVKLSNYHPGAVAKSVDGVTYTVESDASYVRDTSGAESCSSSTSDANADYLKISSKVSWQGTGSTKPITATSIVTPRNGVFSDRGSLVVKLLDRAGAALPGIPVEITSPELLTVRTNSLGCAFFGNLTPGTKQGGFAVAGYVDPAGNQDVRPTNWSVTRAQTTLYTLQYDRAATVNLSFDTKIGAASSTSAIAQYVTFVNSNVPAPPTTGRRVFTLTPAGSTATVTGLFPFSSGYTVYSGNCDPGQVPPTTPPENVISATTDPGGTSSVTVRAPAMYLKVVQGTGTTAFAGASIRVKNTTCNFDQTFTADAAGGIANGSQGFPYGAYSVCADGMTGTPTAQRRHSTATSVTLNDYRGNPNTSGAANPQTISVPTSGTGSVLGVCP